MEDRTKNDDVINWQFTTEDPRIKLKRLHQTNEPFGGNNSSIHSLCQNDQAIKKERGLNLENRIQPNILKRQHFL